MQAKVRMHTGWGEHSTTEAVRNVLKQAILDPLNQRFVLLSETCVPLYPPSTVYQQLMIGSKSRINACQRDWWERHDSRYPVHQPPKILTVQNILQRHLSFLCLKQAAQYEADHGSPASQECQNGSVRIFLASNCDLQASLCRWDLLSLSDMPAVCLACTHCRVLSILCLAFTSSTLFPAMLFWCW